MDRPLDRRVQRTRQLLSDALVSLVLEKGYEAVTVQDILDRANLGRSTFYAHYRSKDDLLVGGLEHLRLALRHQAHDPASGGIAPADFSLALFRHAADYHRLYKVMVGKQGGTLALATIHEDVRVYAHRYLTGRWSDAPPPVPLDVAVEYLTSSLLGLLIWWLDHDMPSSPEEIDAQFRLLVFPGLGANVRGDDT